MSTAQVTLKSFFSPELVRRLGADVARAHSSFAEHAFVRDACTDLDKLELLDRGKHIAAALSKHLPPSYPEAIEILLRSLGPEHTTGELVGAGMAPFYYLPHVLFVAERGLDHFDLSMRAQYELTKRFSAESSIRAYIAKDPERTFAVLHAWAFDANAHVRRLVSEGTRLRLPWAARVPWLDAHPERVIALLELLKDDVSTMVRRSVANNLNDLGKVHAELAIEVCRRWSSAATPERRWIVKHALRSLVKRGHRGALQVLGAGSKPRIKVERVRFAPASVRRGEALRFSCEALSVARVPQDLLVDYIVHFVKANGGTRPKVFKLRRVVLPTGGSVKLEGKVSFANMTTRRHYAGRHRIDLLVNGTVYPLGTFSVRDEPAIGLAPASRLGRAAR